MQRMGFVTKVRPDKLDQYVKLHAEVWPEVLRCDSACHVENYSIFLKTLPHGEHYLFAYFEYTGDDFDADMQRMAADADVQRWWAVCKPCLEPVEPLLPGEVWAPMQSVFYQP